MFACLVRGIKQSRTVLCSSQASLATNMQYGIREGAIRRGRDDGAYAS